MKFDSHQVRKVTKPNFSKNDTSFQDGSGFPVFAKNLIHSFVLLLLEYGSANGFLTFCQKQMSGKNFVLELWSKNRETNQNAGFFKLQYLTKELSHEAEVLHVVSHSQEQQIYSSISSGRGQACLGMPNVTNSVSASFQELAEL